MAWRPKPVGARPCRRTRSPRPAPPRPRSVPRVAGLALAQERLQPRAQRGQLSGLLDRGQQVVGLVAVQEELVAADAQHARELQERLCALVVQLAGENLEGL